MAPAERSPHAYSSLPGHDPCKVRGADVTACAYRMAMHRYKADMSVPGIKWYLYRHYAGMYEWARDRAEEVEGAGIDSATERDLLIRLFLVIYAQMTLDERAETDALLALARGPQS